jgi:hypothetical protein
LLLILGGCKKHYVQKHYTGTFVFSDHYTSTGTDTVFVYTRTITFEGKDRTGCIIRIYTWDQFFDVYVDRKGSFTYSAKDQTHESLAGSFSDNNDLHFSWNFLALSGSTHHEVTGVRQ